MPKHIVIAGASGLLGREVIRACQARGHRVTALVRDASRGVWLPANAVRVVDARHPASLRGAFDGADAVFSCVGASVSLSLNKGWRSFSEVDIPANLNLLREAQAAKVGRFVYVSLFGARERLHLDYARAHEHIVDALHTSGLSYSVMRPLGFFSALGELQDLARRGLVPVIGRGDARTNPIHEQDLARACAEELDSAGPSTERPLGGPEVLTRREISQLAFCGLSRPPRLLPVPTWMFKTNALALRPLLPRLSHAMSFFASITTEDTIAPAYGSRTLGDYFTQRAQRVA